MTLGCFGFEKSISHRNAMMEMKVTSFVSTVPKTISVINAVNSFNTQNYILFIISASGLFLKY